MVNARWAVIACLAAAVACDSEPSSPKPAPAPPIADAREADPPRSYVFYCQARLHAREWDGKRAVEPMPSSVCSTQNRCMEYVETPEVSIDGGLLTVSSRCLSVSHAFCFDFLEPTIDPAEIERQLRARVEDGRARCFLSSFDCLDDWSAHAEQRGSARDPPGLMRTTCQVF